MPTTKLYRREFKYTPAAETNVLATWRKFGFRPTTYNQRRARQGGADVPPPGASVEDLQKPPRRPTLMLASTKK